MNDDQRRRLAAKAKILGRRALDVDVRCEARMPPWIDEAVNGLIVRFALENPAWGYCRIQGELKDVGHWVASTTIAKVLKENGIKPAPDRPSSWRRSRGT